jgi:hypothetical protein
MIEKLISRSFKTRNGAHLSHWTTKSFSQHSALGEFYEGLTETLDKYVEAHQGAFGLVGDVPGETIKDITQQLKGDVVWLEDNRDKLCCDIAALGNIVDELSALYLKTLYKLENLR